MLLCSLQGKIVRDGRFTSICEVKTFLCLRSCPARTTKHVPALLQAVSFSHSVLCQRKVFSYCAQVFATLIKERLVVLVRCLLVAVTKFQDKFASLRRLRQVNSSNSQDKFQICCTDMYLVEFRGISRVFVNFADILELRGSATA